MKIILYNLVILTIGVSIALVLNRKTKLNQNAIQHQWEQEIYKSHPLKEILKNQLKIGERSLEDPAKLNGLIALHPEIVKNERDNPELRNELLRYYHKENTSQLSNLELYSEICQEISKKYTECYNSDEPNLNLVITKLRKIPGDSVAFKMQMVNKYDPWKSKVKFYHGDKLMDSLDMAGYKNPISDIEAFLELGHKTPLKLVINE
jgi:hypothetical protein